MRIADVTRRMYDLLGMDGGRWTKRAFHKVYPDGTTHYCLEGARQIVLQQAYTSGEINAREKGGLDKQTSWYLQTVLQDYAARSRVMSQIGMANIIVWNDMPSRRLPHVLDFLDVATKKADDQDL